MNLFSISFVAAPAMTKMSVLSTSNNAHFSRTHCHFWENNDKNYRDLSGQQGHHKDPSVLICWWWSAPGIARGGRHKRLRRPTAGRLLPPRATSAAEGLWSRSRRFLPCSAPDPGSITPTSSTGSGALRLTQPPGDLQTSIALPPSPSFSSGEGSLSLALFLQDLITHIINSVSAAPDPPVAL